MDSFGQFRRATGLCSRPTPVPVVDSWVVQDHRECRTCRTLVRRRHAGVHQCSSRIPVSVNSALHLLRWTHWRLDEKQQAENERRQDSTAACQADHHRAPTAFCPCQAFVRSDRPWRQHRRSANHSLPRRRATPVVPILITPASDGQIFSDFGGREDAGTRVRQQPSWLL